MYVKNIAAASAAITIPAIPNHARGARIARIDPARKNPHHLPSCDFTVEITPKIPRTR